ncbi:MAG: aminodeoxychorismate synthase component I [Proteobacteria bacterium]|nr:aminodeoxychorismate synthase component I [Pseudomonadota bacterium]
MAAAHLDCYALLDDHAASATDRRSRLYSDCCGVLACDSAAALPRLLDDMQREVAAGKHAVALFSYELGAALHAVAPRADGTPWAQVLLFTHCATLSAEEVDAWLQQDSPAGVAHLRASATETDFSEAVARIHRYLEAGDTYQVNYTYRLRFDAYGEPRALYRMLRTSQPAPYGALIGLPDGRAVLSLSPELFVRHHDGVLTARPMKGTAPAGDDATQNAERSAALAADPKNRAENVMIVDLLRNDLGRVAVPGSVQVSQLFDVERFGSVLQMTSTITATVPDNVTLPELFTALFPCGSITGAPKHRTMHIIRELEPDARGLYTGAIGWFAAPPAEKTIGDFCLSVPIRTLLLQPQREGVRSGELGVGAGIVHDSSAQEEYAECRLKARFLTGLRHDFSLLETMRASVDGCAYLERHLARLRASAAYFGFVWHEQAVRDQLQQVCAALPPGAHRLRLVLDQDGHCAIQTAPLLSLQEPVGLLLAQQRTRTDALFLRHKTTQRAVYDAAWRDAEAQGAFDALFCNERGDVTEGARSNLFVKLDGRWYTPPLSAGLLPGVMRSVLLDDPAWQASERSITISDLRAAEEVVVCNALRGVLRARIQWQER